MTELSYPFPPAVPGDLSDPGVIATAGKWRDLTRWWAQTGVHQDYDDGDDGTLNVLPRTDALAVDLTPGSATVQGFHYENTTRLRFDVKAADATRDRWDRIVARLVIDPTTGSGRVRAFYVPGTPGSPQARPLTQTDTTWELGLGRFRVGAGQGRTDEPVGDFFSKSSRSAHGRPESDQLPDPQDASYPWRPGERCYVYGDGVRAAAWWEWDGINWCIEPGQLIFYSAFTDGSANDYKQGLYRIGQRGGTDSNAFITLPRVRYNGGLRFRWHCYPGVVGKPNGDVITTALYNYGPGGSVGPIGMPERTLLNEIAPSPFFNSTINGESIFMNNGDGLPPPGTTMNFCVAGLFGAGLVHFTEGRLSVETI